MNRYERKKDIPLAIRACAGLKRPATLVIAGGYDERVIENVEHHLELVNLSKKLGVNAVFLRSISSAEKVALLQRTDILLYTPQNEHFGIVPVEAMYMECTVIACNSGGPLESILHGKTGYLLPSDPKLWTDQINEVLTSGVHTGKAGKQRVIDLFSQDAFADKLVSLLESRKDK